MPLPSSPDAGLTISRGHKDKKGIVFVPHGDRDRVGGIVCPRAVTAIAELRIPVFIGDHPADDVPVCLYVQRMALPRRPALRDAHDELYIRFPVRDADIFRKRLPLRRIDGVALPLYGDDLNLIRERDNKICQRAQKQYRNQDADHDQFFNCVHSRPLPVNMSR